MATFWYFVQQLFHTTGRLSRHQWLMVLLGVALWGAFCMRGFGSRKHV